MGKIRNLFDQEHLIYAGGILYCAIASSLVWWMGFTRPAKLVFLYGVPRLDILYLRAGGPAILIRLFVSFLVIGGSYWFAYRWAEKARGKLAWAAVILGMLVQAGILLYMAPFNSTDIFDNISHGRIVALFHGNPFRDVSANYLEDPFTWFTGWPYAPSAYGPVWEYMASLVARLAGDGMVENILAFKLLPGIFWIGCIGLVALITRKHSPENALKSTLFVAWNPVALFEIWGNGHNDPAFVLWILMAVWMMLDRRYTLAVLSLVVGTLVKFMPLILIPTAGLIALRALPDWRQRISYLIRTGLLSAVLVAAAYAPFWDGLQTLSIDRRARLFDTTLGAMLFQILSPSLGIDRAAALIGPTAAVLTLLFASWMGYRAMRSNAPDRFARSALFTLSFYLLATVLFFWPWYTVWLIVLVPLVRDARLRSLAVVFSFAALTKDLIFYPLMHWPLTPLPQPWQEIWQTLGVMAIPWGYAIYLIVSRKRERAQVPEMAPIPVTSEEESSLN